MQKNLTFEQYLENPIMLDKWEPPFTTQSDMLGHELDFIIRYEHSWEDVKKICGIIGLEGAGSLKHLCKTPGKKPYRGYYTKETRDFVAEKWKEDIERFGFEF